MVYTLYWVNTVTIGDVPQSLRSTFNVQSDFCNPCEHSTKFLLSVIEDVQVFKVLSKKIVKMEKFYKLWSLF